MNNPSRLPRSIRLSRALAALGLLTTSAPFALAGAFSFTDAGPYDYTNTANWGGAVIGNNWTSSLTAHQTITFSTDYSTVDPDGGGSGSATINITNNSLFNHTFVGGGGNRTLTLGGGISLASSTTNANTTTFGSLTDGQRLNVDLGGASRTFFSGTNRTLDVLNTLSGTGGISKTGLGTLRLTNTSNTYTGSTSLGASGQSSGVLEVTKVADVGQASSMGASSSNNSIVFGGTVAGTLRYIGSGDSSNRTFLIGGSGAIFDASGTDAVLWTSTASPTYASVGNARTITFKGSNTDGNTIAAGFLDSGAGQTSLLKQDAGRWILAGNNTHTGTTTIDAGTLELGSSGSGGNGSNLILNGGTFATGGFDETFGTLAVNGNATIDFGSSNISDLVFSASDGVSWGESVSLSIINFNEGFDSIRFGGTNEGLGFSQLGKITINGFAAAIDEQGYLSAIPEPSSFAALAGLSILGVSVGLRRRRSA